MLKVRWTDWRGLAGVRRDEILGEAAAALATMEGAGSAMFSLLGHKGDLLLVHFRQNFEQLGEVERSLEKLALWDYLEQTSSYLSVVELGLYDSTDGESLRGGWPSAGSSRSHCQWNAEIQETLTAAADRDASAIVSGDAAAQIRVAFIR